MADYEMQESNLPNEEGKRVVYPRMILWGQTETKEIVENISKNSTFTTGEISGIIEMMTREVAYRMAMGYSVKIDGLGVFTPSLALRKAVNENDEEDDARKRNATSIYLNNINFKADKEFIRQTAVNCKLKRSKTKFRQSSQKLLPEERLKRAQEYLKENGVMNIGDYCRITGLLRNTAANELRKWREMPETGIDTKGRGTHKVYILKN